MRLRRVGLLPHGIGAAPRRASRQHGSKLGAMDADVAFMRTGILGAESMYCGGPLPAAVAVAR